MYARTCDLITRGKPSGFCYYHSVSRLPVPLTTLTSPSYPIPPYTRNPPPPHNTMAAPFVGLCPLMIMFERHWLRLMNLFVTHGVVWIGVHVRTPSTLREKKQRRLNSWPRLNEIHYCETHRRGPKVNTLIAESVGPNPRDGRTDGRTGIKRSRSRILRYYALRTMCEGRVGGGEGEGARFRIQAAGATRRKWEMAVGMATTLTVHYKKN